MTTKFCPQFETMQPWASRVVRDQGIRWVKWAGPDGPNIFPGAQTIGRPGPADDSIETPYLARGKDGAASYWANRMLPAMARAPWVRYWELVNEPDTSVANAARLNAFIVELERLLWTYDPGAQVLVPCFAVGWPDAARQDIPDAAPLFAPMFRDPRAILAYHGYGKDAQQDDPEWYALRYRRTLRELQAATGLRPRVAITECGTYLPWHDRYNEEQIIDQFRWMGEQIAGDADVLCWSPFVCGATQQWKGFDLIESMIVRIAQAVSGIPDVPMASPAHPPVVVTPPEPPALKLLWPLPAQHHTITGPFGDTGPDYPASGHKGLDIACPTGTPVFASHAGTVQAGNDPPGYGYYYVVIGAQCRTVYGHLSAWGVASGIRIEAGNMIGLSGSTGNSTGAHLHLEVQINGVAVDPLLYMDVPSEAPVEPPAEPQREPLPEDELYQDVPMLAQKCRWWVEESIRQVEAVNLPRALEILKSLTILLGRLEGAG